jgi:hypothetical protein
MLFILQNITVYYAELIAANSHPQNSLSQDPLYLIKKNYQAGDYVESPQIKVN